MDHFKLTYEIDTEDIHWYQHDQSKWNFKDFYSYRGNILVITKKLITLWNKLKLKVESN